MSSLVSSDVERFRDAVAERLALWFDDAKLDYLATVLEQRLAALPCAVTNYLRELEDPARGGAELRQIARALTVGETYFFRHPDQFRAFAEIALPERIKARGSARELRLLSAGCSSGDEAYSLSILTRQSLPDPAWVISITGIDINPDILERAAQARYSAWSLRETPEAIRTRYFVPDGRDYVLADAVRAAVQFREESLVEAGPWLPGSLDVVFCRNVLMYFTPEQAARAVRKLALALAPGGYLFLGSAETLRGLSEDFELRHTHATFYYQRKVGSRERPEPAPVSTAHLTRRTLPTLARPTALLATAAPASTEVDLEAPLELLAQERFSEALAALRTLAPGAAESAEVSLLHAALLTHSGDLAAAEQACAELIAIDGLSSGAHYLQALCRERTGDAQAATEHSQTASYLDPGFAMPHLHLGLMARRAGDRAAARRELSQAALLLQREDASRLLLFGGGFDRRALIAMCCSELELLGDPK